MDRIHINPYRPLLWSVGPFLMMYFFFLFYLSISVPNVMRMTEYTVFDRLASESSFYKEGAFLSQALVQGWENDIDNMSEWQRSKSCSQLDMLLDLSWKPDLTHGQDLPTLIMTTSSSSRLTGRGQARRNSSSSSSQTENLSKAATSFLKHNKLVFFEQFLLTLSLKHWGLRENIPKVQGTPSKPETPHPVQDQVSFPQRILFPKRWEKSDKCESGAGVSDWLTKRQRNGSLRVVIKCSISNISPAWTSVSR